MAGFITYDLGDFGLQLRGDLGFLRGFFAARNRKETLSTEQIHSLREIADRGIKAAERLEVICRLFLEVEALGVLSEETSRKFLIHTDRMIADFKRFATSREQASSLISEEDLNRAWPSSVNTKIEKLIDFLDDFQETVAVGHSSAFREDVNKAREEADIANRKPSLSSD